MEHIKCIWFHNFDDEPVLIYSEIDKERNETRKVEVFRNGKVGYANNKKEHDSFLGLTPIPSIDEINESKEFYAMKISSEEFEIVWKDKTLKITEE